MGDPQQQSEKNVVGDKGRPAIGHERQRDPGKGQHSKYATDDHERLDTEGDCQAGCEKLREFVPGANCHAEAGTDEQDERGDDGGRAEKTELLTDHSKDEVGLRGRNTLG